MLEEDAEIGVLALEKGLVSQEALNEVLSKLAEDGGLTIVDLFRDRKLLTAEQIKSLRAEALKRIRGREEPEGADAERKADPTERDTVVVKAPAPPRPPAPVKEPEETTATSEVPVPPEAVRATQDPQNVFGNFILVQQVGKGSQTAVWKGWDTLRGRWAAIKIFKDGAGPDVDALAKFIQEATVSEGFSHPGIAALLEAGRRKRGGAEVAYVAQDFVEGESLDLVRARGMELKRAAELIRDAAIAMAHAHGKGIIHKDIKPRNLMIGLDGKVKVTDFGLTYHAATLGPDDDNNLSRVVQVMGTPSYLSPEQALGRTSDIDERSDVYALAATLYFLITGKPPFDAGNPMKTCFAVVQDELVPPSQHTPAAKGDLERIIQRSMAKDPVQRYESASSMATDLDHYIQGVPIATDDQRRYTQGLRALDAGRLEEAIHMFKDLIRIESNAKGDVIGSERVMAEIKSGEEGLTLAIAQQTKNYHIRTQRGILRFARAIIMSLEGLDPSASCKEALEDFVIATSLRAESSGARVNRANVLIFGGRYARDSGKDVSSIFDMATKDLDAAIQFDPTSSHAYHNRGIVNFYIARAMKKGSGDPEPHYRKAIEDFSRGAELEPTYAYIFKDLGVAKVSLAKHLLAQGQKVKNLFVEAVHHLDVACKVNSSIYGAFYERGQAHFALKDFKSAIRDFRRCLELDPGREGKIQALIDEAQKHLDTRKY